MQPKSSMIDMNQPVSAGRGRFSPARAADAISAGSGAAAMALGVVSVGLQLDGLVVLSVIWLVAAGLTWVMLATIFAARLTGDRPRWRTEAQTAPALTAVAATTVLGTRVTQLGWSGLAIAVLCLATAAWLVLMPPVVGNLPDHAVGAYFLVCVATEGLAVLAAAQAQAQRVRWLEVAALVVFLLGLALYLIVLSRFSVAQLRTGAGDHWVSTGALAISALAGARILTALAALSWTPSWLTALRVVDVTILCVALAGYLALVVAEVRWPRPGYDVRRWATAFPLGMTATAAFSVARAADIKGFRVVGQVLIWPAVVICVVLAAAGTARVYRAGAHE
jgi:tellurite resistance protein TehA-like permease